MGSSSATFCPVAVFGNATRIISLEMTSTPLVNVGHLGRALHTIPFLWVGHHWQFCCVESMAMNADYMVLAVRARHKPNGICRIFTAVQPSDLSRLLTGTTNRKVHEFWLRSRAQSHVVLGGHCRNGVCLAPAPNCIMREWCSVRH